VEFALLLLVTAILFIRPTDFVPGLQAVNLYFIAIVPCIILSWHKLVPQLTSAGLRKRPVLVFGIGMLLVSLITNFAHQQFQIGFDCTVNDAKLIALYLLVLAQLDTPRRLKVYLGWLVAVILIQTLLAVLNYHGYISIDSFMPDEDRIATMVDGFTGVRRLRGTGLFGDPNDVCEILNCAIIFSLYGLLDRGAGCTRVIWLVPLALFGHALALTHSRGGFLGLVVGLMVLLRSRYRGTKSLVLAGVVLGLMFLLFAGRQTSLSTSEGNSQARIALWHEGFQLLPRSPLIGLGIGQFNVFTSHVTHNAFLQMYVELGFVGGTFLFGQYFYCLKSLAKLGSKRVTLLDPEIRRLRPFLLASLASFATSEMSLSNPSSPMTYTMLGLATVGIRLADASPPLPDLLVSWKLVGRTVLFSGLFLIGLYVFVRLTFH